MELNSCVKRDKDMLINKEEDRQGPVTVAFPCLLFLKASVHSGWWGKGGIVVRTSYV